MEVLQSSILAHWFYFRLAEGCRLEAGPAALQLVHTQRVPSLPPFRTAGGSSWHWQLQAANPASLAAAASLQT